MRVLIGSETYERIELGKYASADQEVTDTTLVLSNHLVRTVQAGLEYAFRFGVFFLNDGAAEGAKFAVDGTCTATAIKAQITIYDDVLNSTVAFARVTALASAVGAGVSAGSNYAEIEGSISVNAAGTLGLSFAQNAAGVNAGVHVEVASFMTLLELA